jgi:UDP-glucose 4-epimerase
MGRNRVAKKVVAVTGAAGYLGEVLIAHLRAQPWVDHIIALDTQPVQSDGRVISYRLDVREASLLRAILAEHGATHLIHAAFVVARTGAMTETQMYANNVVGSQLVIRAALEYGIRQLLFVSSVSVYGYHPGTPNYLAESYTQRPNMIYGQHKVAVERFLREQAELFKNTRVTIVRPTAIVGPRGRIRSPLKRMTDMGFFTVVNGGNAQTQAIHEDDAADLIVRAVDREAAGVFHAAPDDAPTWADIGRLGGRMISIPRFLMNFATKFSTLRPELEGLTPEIVSYLSESLVVDNAAAKTALGWHPRYTTLQAFAPMFGVLPPKSDFEQPRTKRTNEQKFYRDRRRTD